MKILFITTQFPYPLDNGGKIGAYNGINVMENGNDMTVLSFTEEPQYVEEGLKFFKSKFKQVRFISPIEHKVHIQKETITLAKVMTKCYLTGIPYVTMKFVDKKMYLLIDSIINQDFYDLIFIDYLNMYIYGEYIKIKHKSRFKYLIFKDHNIEYQIFKQAAESSRGLKKIILNKEWKDTRKYEIDAIKKSDLVFSVCDENATLLRKYNKQSFAMKPTFEIIPFRDEISSEHKLLYIGNLSWKANLEGLQWFVKNVWPKLLKEIPDVTIDIIGGGLKENPFENIIGINYRGYVKDIDDIYKDYKIFIVPLFEGSGIRIKILEAFNNDISVVSTTMACETIGVTNQKEIMMADDPEEFKDAILKLLTQNEFNYNIRNNAKEFLSKNYALESRQGEIKKMIDTVLFKK